MVDSCEWLLLDSFSPTRKLLLQHVNTTTVYDLLRGIPRLEPTPLLASEVTKNTKTILPDLPFNDVMF